MSEFTGIEDRIGAFAQGCLDALTPDRRAECDLLAGIDRGMRLRPAEDDPHAVELLYGGAVIGVTTWDWLNGVPPESVGPGEYRDE
jgi:hypothetical protein